MRTSELLADIQPMSLSWDAVPDWETKRSNQQEPQTDEQLASILYLLLRNSDKLRTDMDRYRRWTPGHKKRTYKYLLKCWDQLISRELEDANQR